MRVQLRDVPAATVVDLGADAGDVRLQALVIERCGKVIEADSEVHPGESLVLRATLDQWVLPREEQERLEPLIYGLDFQVVPRLGVSIPA